MIFIDGSFGEGGGQILRSSLGLSLVTRKPFTITNIRAGRKKPGLLRQHLTAVTAATQIGNAHVKGDNMASTQLVFEPQDIIPGKYHFKVGTAGSATLVLQTVLPALIIGKTESMITLEGGTHNPYAPPFDFLQYSFLPCLKMMGVNVDCFLRQHGFYPAGGGMFFVKIIPVEKLEPLELLHKGFEKSVTVTGIVSELPLSIAEQEVGIILSKMKLSECNGQSIEVTSSGPGNIVFAKTEYENICEVFTGFGQRTVSLHKVADSVVTQLRKYTASEVPVGEYLADQLLIPFAMAGKGKFRTYMLSQHTLTNIEIIKKFLDVEIVYSEIKNNVWEIEIQGESYEMDKI